MPSVNDLLADAATSHAVDLQQYSTGVVQRLIKLLNETDSDLAEALSRALDRLPAERFTVQRLEALLASVRKLNLQAYNSVQRELTPLLKQFAEYEAAHQAEVFEATIPGEIQARYAIARIDFQQTYSAALSRPFQGRLLRDWAKRLESDRLELIRNSVRLGYMEGQATTEIVRRIRGTAAARFGDGALNRSRRELETVVRSAIGHMAEVTRERFVKANRDLVDVVMWHATIDTKTSEICRIRDRKRYTAATHKPIGHQVPWLQGPGRSHWVCRSASLPVTKSWRELGFAIDDLSPGTRASMDGQVPAETTFGDWLQRQSARRQDQVVGATRGELMREGKLPFDSLYSNRGEWLSIEQLRERDAAAFGRAGL